MNHLKDASLHLSMNVWCKINLIHWSMCNEDWIW